MHRKRIGLDPNKAKATQAVEYPITCKQFKSFIKKVSYVRSFIFPWSSSSSIPQVTLEQCAILVGREAT